MVSYGWLATPFGSTSAGMLSIVWVSGWFHIPASRLTSGQFVYFVPRFFRMHFTQTAQSLPDYSYSCPTPILPVPKNMPIVGFFWMRLVQRDLDFPTYVWGLLVRMTLPMSRNNTVLCSLGQRRAQSRAQYNSNNNARTHTYMCACGHKCTYADVGAGCRSRFLTYKTLK